MQSNVEQTSVNRSGTIKVYPVIRETSTTMSSQSWTGDTDVSSHYLGDDNWYAENELPRRILSSEETASVKSVMTEHYLDQIKDREERESARRNIEFLRGQGFLVRGCLYDGQYTVKFSTPTKVEVMSLKSFVKAKLRDLLTK